MRKVTCKLWTIGLSAIMMFSFAGCGSDRSESVASVSSTFKPKATATSTPTEEVKNLSVVSTSSADEKKERDGYDEGTTKYDFNGLSFSVPNYFSLDSSSTSDSGVWYAETGESVVMFSTNVSNVKEPITDENIEQYKGIAPAQLVTGMNNSDAGLHYNSSDITNKKNLTVGGYPALSFEITGEMNNENAPDIKTVYNKIVLVFIPGTTTTDILTLAQGNNSKYSYISDFDKIVSNIIPYEEQNVSSSTSSSSTSVDPNQVTPELKAFLDSYEAFVDQYIGFMQQYQENPTDLTLLQQYAEYMTKLADFEKKSNEYQAEESQMSTADSNYYIDVTTRCAQKLLQVSANISKQLQ